MDYCLFINCNAITKKEKIKELSKPDLNFLIEIKIIFSDKYILSSKIIQIKSR